MKNTYIWLFVAFYLFCMETQASPPTNESGKVKTSESSSPIMPKYGNWCGPGHPKNIENAASPIDMLDTACQEHDICYVQKGYLSCECDNEFNNKIIQGLKKGSFEGAEIIFARSFRAYFKGSPCIGNQKDKIAPSRAIHNAAKKVGNKTAELVDKIPFIGD